MNFTLTFFSAVPSPVIFLLLLFVLSQDHRLFFSRQIDQIYPHWESETYFSNIASSSLVIQSGDEEIDLDFSWSKMAPGWQNDFAFAGDNCALSYVFDADCRSYFLNVTWTRSWALSKHKKGFKDQNTLLKHSYTTFGRFDQLASQIFSNSAPATVQGPPLRPSRSIKVILLRQYKI